MWIDHIFFFSDFGTYIYLKQYFLISCILLISLNQNISIIFVKNIDIGNITLPKKLYIKLDIVQNLYEFYQFYLSEFLSLKCLNTPKYKNIPVVKICPNGQNVLIPPICILLSPLKVHWHRFQNLSICSFKNYGLKTPVCLIKNIWLS